MGPGARAHHPAEEQRRFPHLHAGFDAGTAGLHPGLAEGAAPGLGRPRRGAAGADPRHRQRPAGPGRHRRRPHAQPRAHPAVHHLRTRLEAGAGSGSGHADHLDPEPAGAQAGRFRRRHLLPAQGSLRPGHGAEQHHGRARICRLAAGRAAGRRHPAGHGRAASRATPSSTSPTSTTPSACSS